MKKVLLMAVFAVLFVTTGCISYRNGDQASQSAKTRILPITYKQQVETGTQQVEGISSQNVLLKFIGWGDSDFADRGDFTTDIQLPFTTADSALYKAAVYNACEKANCDYLACVTYKITSKDYFIFSTRNCVVKGFPVFIKGIEKVEMPCKDGCPLK